MTENSRHSSEDNSQGGSPMARFNREFDRFKTDQIALEKQIKSYEPRCLSWRVGASRTLPLGVAGAVEPMSASVTLPASGVELNRLHQNQKFLREKVREVEDDFWKSVRPAARALSHTDFAPHRDDYEHAKHFIREWKSKFPTGESKFMKLFIGDVTITLDKRGERLKVKQAYERFKATVTPWWLLCNVLVLFTSYRWLDMLYQIFLVYYYSTLALRENILRMNGSNIKTWWIRHHYLSLVCVFAICMWPDSESYRSFRGMLFLYTLYSGFVQVLQTKYQMSRLYTLRALGQADIMDVANSDSAQMQWAPNMVVLLPFLFTGHLYAAVNGLYCFYLAWLHGLREPNVPIVAATFLAISFGNVYTTIQVLLKKRHAPQGPVSQRSLTPTALKKAS
eukprot:tig00021127_g18812.t1